MGTFLDVFNAHFKDLHAGLDFAESKSPLVSIGRLAPNNPGLLEVMGWFDAYGLIA